MTCIVGFKDRTNDCVYIGADSLGSNGYSKVVRTDKKVFNFNGKKDILMGFTSSYRMGQLLMYSDSLFSEIDLLKDEKLDHKYIVTKFIPQLISLYRNNGYDKKYNDGELKGGTFLLGVKNELYIIQGDFQVGISSDDYMACGSGEDFALGSMHSTEGLKLSPVDRVRTALEAAEKFSVGVQRPFYIMNTLNDDVIEIK